MSKVGKGYMKVDSIQVFGDSPHQNGADIPACSRTASGVGQVVPM